MLGPTAGRSSLVEAYLARSGMFTPGVGDPRRYDEMTGTERQPAAGLVRAGRRAGRHRRARAAAG